MTKPSPEVALLRLFKAVEEGKCVADEAMECFWLGYGTNRLRSPIALKAECRQKPELGLEIRRRLLVLTYDE